MSGSRVKHALQHHHTIIRVGAIGPFQRICLIRNRPGNEEPEAETQDEYACKYGDLFENVPENSFACSQTKYVLPRGVLNLFLTTGSL